MERREMNTQEWVSDVTRDEEMKTNLSLSFSLVLHLLLLCLTSNKESSFSVNTSFQMERVSVEVLSANLGSITNYGYCHPPPSLPYSTILVCRVLSERGRVWDNMRRRELESKHHRMDRHVHLPLTGLRHSLSLFSPLSHLSHSPFNLSISLIFVHANISCLSSIPFPFVHFTFLPPNLSTHHFSYKDCWHIESNVFHSFCHRSFYLFLLFKNCRWCNIHSLDQIFCYYEEEAQF